MWYYDLGTTEPQQWFTADDPPYAGKWDGYSGCRNVTFQEGAASQDGTRLAMVIENDNVKQYQIALFSANPGDLTSNPPVDPTISPCLVRPPDGSAGSNRRVSRRRLV